MRTRGFDTLNPDTVLLDRLMTRILGLSFVYVVKGALKVGITKEGNLASH